MNDRRGSALALVLWMIVALSAVASGVVLSRRVGDRVVANYRARTAGRYAAESGVDLAVATLENGLARLGDPDARRAYLDHLDSALGEARHVDLGDERLDVALVDVGARLDVNSADARALGRLFAYFTDPVSAERTATAIETFIRGGGSDVDIGTLVPIRPLRSLDELASIAGVSRALAERAAPYLTVDGDGSVNRATASDTVVAAAAGDLRDEPSRILLVSRGWRVGVPLTHEIQAVYAIQGERLALVRWRERDL